MAGGVQRVQPVAGGLGFRSDLAQLGLTPGPSAGPPWAPPSLCPRTSPPPASLVYPLCLHQLTETGSPADVWTEGACALISHPGRTARDLTAGGQMGRLDQRSKMGLRWARGGRSGRGLLGVLTMFPCPLALSFRCWLVSDLARHCFLQVTPFLLREGAGQEWEKFSSQCP